MAVDPVTGAVIGWLVGQIGTAGKSGLARLIRGDKQRDALRRVVRDAVEAATSDIADGVVLCNALLADSPEAQRAEVVDVLDLRTALARQVYPKVGMLAEQGYLFDAESFINVLVQRVMVGIQADALRDGPLVSLAEYLRHHRLAAANELTVAELRGIKVGIDRLSRGGHVGSDVDRELGGSGLPGEVEYFTGRLGPVEDLLARVAAHDPAGLVAAVFVIDGMPGVGKTAFVIHAAHMLAARYPDGAIFIDLLGFTGPRPLSVAQALDELLAQAGVARARIPADVGPKQALWRRVMRERRALVVLDNAHDAGQVEPLLPRAAGGLVLVTARSKLYDLDATPLPLAVLTAAEARSLFTAVAGASRCRDGAAMDRIVATCHRLPLAVRLMAGRVRHGDPIQEVAADIEELPAEKKIRSLFDLSYSSLSEDLKRAVRLLGVYPGIDITGEVMAALADTSSAEGRRLLRGLAMHNLIDRSTEQVGERTREYTAGSRYRPHDLLRDYARARAEADESPAARDAALNRLTAHYLAMVTAAKQQHQGPAEPSRGTAPDAAGLELDGVALADAWLAVERANLLACIDTVPVMPAALPVITGRLLDRLCYWPEAARSFQRALVISREIGNRPGEAYALRDLAMVERVSGRYEAAGERFEQALVIFREIGNRSGQGGALWGLAVMNWVLSQYAPARERYEQALVIFREVGDRSGEAYALWGLASVDWVLGRYEPAREQLERGLAIGREIGDQSAEAFALWGLAEVDRARGRYDPARQRYAQALTISQEIGDRFSEPFSLRGLAEVDHARGRYDPARQRFAQALTISQEIGDRYGAAEAMRGLAGVDRMLDRPEAARQRYEQALSVCRSVGDRLGEASSLWGLGLLADGTADTATASERWQEALQIFEALQIPFAETVRENLARLNQP